MRKLMLIACLVLPAACAQMDPLEIKEEKPYVTGSNLPQRDRSGVVTASPEAFEKTRTQGVGQSQPKTGG